MGQAVRAASIILGGLPSEGAEETIGRYCAAGISSFLLPGRLLADLPRLLALTSFIRAETDRAGIGPALVALGGSAEAAATVPVFPGFPSPLLLGALSPRAGRATARQAGRLAGAILAGAGVDLVFGPRLDLATDPKAPEGILDRFGEEPEAVGGLGAAWLRGLRSSGAAACAHGFPGAGNLCAEGGSGQTLLPFPLERLAEVEARPFLRAIARGLPALLVGRFLVPALEPERIPAARSVRVIEGRIRAELRFRGLIVGAELGDDPAEPGHAAVLGALAGCDLAVAAEPGTALAAAAALEAALAAGELPAPRVLVARGRAESLLRRNRHAARGLRGASRATLPTATTDSGIVIDRYVTQRSLIDRLEARAVGRGFALLANHGGFPLPPGRTLVLLVLPPGGSAGSVAALAGREVRAARDTLRETFPGAHIVEVAADGSPEQMLGAADAVCRAEAGGPFVAALVLSCDAHLHPGQEGLIRLVGERAPLSLVALRDPYDAAFFPCARGLAAAFGWSPEGVRAAARLAAGSFIPRGRAPVGILGLEV